MTNERREGNGYRQGEMSFREWLPTYEREQEHHSNQIAGLIANHGQLAAEVATISANVQTLLNNQTTISERMNRPWQWGVVVAVFLGIFSMAGAFATVLNLSRTPIKSQLSQQHEHTERINSYFEERMNNVEALAAVSSNDREWLEKVSDYNREHIDKLWFQVKAITDTTGTVTGGD